MRSSPCPSCGSADVRRVDGDQERCNACDALFTVAGDGTVRVQEAGRPVATRAPGGRPAAWLAVAVIGLGLAGAVFWTLRPVEDDAPSLAVNVPAKQNGLSLKIDHVREGRSADDHAFWIMTLRNDGTRPIRTPAAVVHLYDSNGASAGDVRANAWTDVLEPGAEVAVLGLDTRANGHDRAEVDVDTVTPAPRDARTTQLMLKTTSVVDSSDGAVIQGEIHNTLDHAVRLGAVQVVGRSREGRPVAWAEGQPKELSLAPGASTTFEARAGDLRVDKPDSWTAYVVAKADGAAKAPVAPEADEP